MVPFISVFFVFTSLINAGHSYINGCKNDPFVNNYPQSNDITLNQNLLSNLQEFQFPWYHVSDWDYYYAETPETNCEKPVFTCRRNEDSACFDRSIFCFKKDSVSDTSFKGVIPIITTHGFYFCEAPAAKKTKLYYAMGLFNDTAELFKEDIFEVDITPVQVKVDELTKETMVELVAGVYIVQHLSFISAEDGGYPTDCVIIVYAFLKIPTLKLVPIKTPAHKNVTESFSNIN